MVMTLRQLATFLELARSGSVRATAARLFVTQPAVSAAVASLQRELGVDLVARDGRGLRLTAAGEVLADYARRIAGLLDEAAVAAVGAATPAGGRVRLAAVTTAGEHILPAAIAEFRSRHPGAEVSLEVTNRSSVWERLEAHEVDLVVAGRPPTAGNQIAGASPRVGTAGEAGGLGPAATRAASSLVRFRTRATRPHELVLVAAPGLVAADATPEELSRHTWLLREPGSGTRSTTEEYLASRGISPGTLTLGSNGAVREAAAVGLGVTLISRDAVTAELAAGRLVIVAAAGIPLEREWHVVSRDEDPLPAPAALFAEHLVAVGGFVPEPVAVRRAPHAADGEHAIDALKEHLEAERMAQIDAGVV